MGMIPKTEFVSKPSGTQRAFGGSKERCSEHGVEVPHGNAWTHHRYLGTHGGNGRILFAIKVRARLMVAPVEEETQSL